MLKHFLNYRWFIVAFIVGSCLNLINQHEALFNSNVTIHWPKFLLTYVVPYLVSSISAWTARTK